MSSNQVKKIAVLYSGGTGMYGIEKYLLNLFEHNNSNEVKLVLFSMGHWPLTEAMTKSGYDVKIFAGKRISLGTIKGIARYLNKNDFSLLVSQGVVSNAYARLISWVSKVPNLVTVHSDLKSEYTNKILRIVYGFSDKALRFKTVKYITVSKYLKNKLTRSGIDKSKIEVIYNGVEFKPTKNRQHRRLVVGSVGRLNHIKGYDILIKAFALANNKRLRLKIAGEGEELANLQQLVKDLKISNRVEFVGFVDDVDGFLDSIDIYAQTSKSEGFGLSVVQAMSRELPVIVTPNGSLPEIVRDGYNGLVSKSTEPDDIARAIDYLAGDYDYSEKLGLNARKSVLEKYNVDNWTKQTINTYLKACK